MALSISLFLLNLAFFINVGQGSNWSDATCWARGAVFHYFLLCVFTWMGLEAFHLYLLIIKVFNTYFGHYFLKLSLVGWGRCSLDMQRAWLVLEGAEGRPVWDREEEAPSLRQAQGSRGGQLEGVLEADILREPQQCHAPPPAPRPACPNGHWHWECQQLRPLRHP